MSKDLVSQVKKEIEQEKVVKEKALVRKMLFLIEAKEKVIADKEEEIKALKEELNGLKDDLAKGDYSEAELKIDLVEWCPTGCFVWSSDDSTATFFNK